MPVPTAPAPAKDRSQAARHAVIRNMGSFDNETRVLATKWLMGDTGSRTAGEVQMMLDILGVRTANLRTMFNSLLAEAGWFN